MVRAIGWLAHLAGDGSFLLQVVITFLVSRQRTPVVGVVREVGEVVDGQGVFASVGGDGHGALQHQNESAARVCGCLSVRSTEAPECAPSFPSEAAQDKRRLASAPFTAGAGQAGAGVGACALAQAELSGHKQQQQEQMLSSSAGQEQHNRISGVRTVRLKEQPTVDAVQSCSFPEDGLIFLRTGEQSAAHPC